MKIYENIENNTRIYKINENLQRSNTNCENLRESLNIIKILRKKKITKKKFSPGRIVVQYFAKIFKKKKIQTMF